MRGWIGALAAVAVVTAVVGIGAVALVLSDDSTAIVDLDVGDCFDLPAGGEDDGLLESVEVVDCAQPHLAEVVALGSLATDDEPYPPDDELFERVENACRPTELTDPEAFGLLPIAPTEELWASFDGRYLCVAIPFGGQPVTGSARAG